MATATIVSLAPLPINEFKPQMNPEYISIPAAKPNDFEILHVHDSQYPLYLDDERGSRIIPEPVEFFARAIVEDYKSAQLLRDTENGIGPGIFYVLGKFTKEEIKKQFGPVLEKARQLQNMWFVKLVETANDDWNRTRQHNHISELQKAAARALNVEPEWLHSTETFGNTKCPACFGIVPEGATICQSCQYVLNLEKYKTMTFATR